MDGSKLNSFLNAAAKDLGIMFNFGAVMLNLIAVIWGNHPMVNTVFMLISLTVVIFLSVRLYMLENPSEWEKITDQDTPGYVYRKIQPEVVAPVVVPIELPVEVSLEPEPKIKTGKFTVKD